MKTKSLYLGCTRSRHEQLGVHAVVNARAGHQHLNHLTDDDWNLIRDARSIRDRITNRVRFYQFNSKFFRRRRNFRRVKHLLSSRHED